MSTGAHERRFRPPSPPLMPECRLCWRTFHLEHHMLEVTDHHVYVRCPRCRGSFPIRHSEFAAFAAGEEQASA